MKHKDFACFILTHGRPTLQKTYKTLKKQGYKGPIYLIVDDEDDCLDEYKRLYGDQVIVFSKDKAAEHTDKGDNLQKKNIVVFARNVCHDIAKDLGLEYFLELDDDYTAFHYRWPKGNKLMVFTPKKIEPVFDAYLDFLDVSGALSVCFMQGGDFIGGAHDFEKKGISRKAMNTFFCRTDRPFKFRGRINEDVCTYVCLAHKGHLFFSTNQISIRQTDTQQSQGGLTDVYLESGTYMKSFYSVIMCPSAVKVSALKDTASRYHHKIDWNACAPKILKEKYRK